VLTEKARNPRAEFAVSGQRYRDHFDDVDFNSSAQII
jgi:hypothetical protein